MPNRIIKDTIRTSKSVNALTDFQFRVWLYLITYADDYGRGSADAELLKGFVFPRRKGITEGQIQKALDDLANIGMISLYEVDGESYFCFPNWGKHQRIQARKEKFPAPPHGDLPLPTVTHGDSPSESESNPNPNPNPISATPPAVSDDAVIRLPLNDGTEHGVKESDIAKWSGLYPAVDVMGELRKMLGWLDANPKNRKTKSGIGRFIAGWLSREQDRAKKVVGEHRESSFDTEDFFEKARKRAEQAMRDSAN
jgi:hypothetical protein